MWKQLLNIWRADNLLQQAWDQSYEALDIGQEMFLESIRVLRYSDDDNVRIEVREKDKIVNKYEREVRRKVITHCAVQGPGTLSGGMALVSIIIDIERIGDYTKNMVDLAANHPQRLNGKGLEEDLKRVEEAVKENFSRTRQCIQRSDKDCAVELLKDYQWVAKSCDNLLLDLVNEKDPSIAAGEAVAIALFVRWLKRVNSHLRNITTSVVNPFDRIGFEPKGNNDI
jgi:phosphate uptake regulator